MTWWVILLEGAAFAGLFTAIVAVWFVIYNSKKS